MLISFLQFKFVLNRLTNLSIDCLKCVFFSLLIFNFLFSVFGIFDFFFLESWQLVIVVQLYQSQGNIFDFLVPGLKKSHKSGNNLIAPWLEGISKKWQICTFKNTICKLSFYIFTYSIWEAIGSWFLVSLLVSSSAAVMQRVSA